ncbi:META domain-containing protein [Sinirhodobacter populi]|uniref:META domain-containing protein n=2 Tax=Paenirhodobacter populi TaxID=2306993 RepID=A0A443IJE9_9RHOB|nr:META domain-containing protein [Sinirhodobacter populi]
MRQERLALAAGASPPHFANARHKEDIMHRLFLIAAATMALGACKAETPSDPLELLGTDTEWTVTDISGVPVPAEVKVTILRPAPGTIAGSSGCNRYTGSAKTVDGRIEIGPLAGTRMMCPEPQMQAETAFLMTIEKTTGLRESGGVLEFTDSAGDVVLKASK